MDQRTQIKSTITEFIKAGDERNVPMLHQLLHADFYNLQDGFFNEKGIFSFSKREYIELIEAKRFGGSPRTIEFVSIDELGNIAVAKVLLESDLIKFTSYIVVVFDGTSWQVASNVPKIEMK